MAEPLSRDQTLIDFQGVTGIDDFDLCTNILAQHDWNLERAVNSIMSFGPPESFVSDIGPSPAREETLSVPLDPGEPITDAVVEGLGVHMRPPDHGASEMASGPSYSSSTLNFSSRMINFNVEYRDRNISVVLPDNETVGRIKEVLETELGIPRDKQELKGLVKRKVDDSTKLRDLYLPRDNSLYLLTPHISNPTLNKAPLQEGEGPSQGLEGEREYNLKIMFHEGSRYKLYNLKFDCHKNVRDVKQGLSAVTDIPVRHQVWTGWPRPVGDSEKLYTCGLDYPTHELEMSASESFSSPKTPADTEDMDVDNDTEEEDTGLENYSLEDDLFSQDEPAPRRIEPLMSDGVTDDKTALEQFSREFKNRYGDCHPDFYIGSLDDAIQESLTVPAAQRKLLAIYLHHDGSIFSNVFCSQLLCAEGIVNYLSVHFVTWAWDLTSSQNMARLLQSATRHFGSLAATQMRGYTPDQLPSLLLISRSKATNEVIDAIQGHITLDEMMTRLIHAVEVFEGQKESDVSEEKQRRARERIKQEQDEAYQESLAADRKKAEAQKEEEDKRREEMEKEMQEQRKEEDKRKEAEQIKEAISKSVATSVPNEPPADCPTKVSCLRFRCPGGQTLSRRFYASDSLADLLNYLISKGFHTEDYKVLCTFPRRDITSLEKCQSLEEARLYPQETLILEER